MDTDNQQETLDFDIGWLVGVWESEGWFSLRACYLDGERLQRYRPECGVTNTDPEVLDNIERILKRLGLPYWRTKWQEVKGQKSRSMIRVDGMQRCKRLMDRLAPFFQSKRDRAKIVKDFIDYRLSLPGKAPYGEKEHQWFAALAELNAPISRRSQNPQRLHPEPAKAG